MQGKLSGISYVQSYLEVLAIYSSWSANSTNAFKLLMELREKTNIEGVVYYTMRTQWLPKFLWQNYDWIKTVLKPFVEKKKQNWEEFLEHVVTEDYKCDEVGLFLFARMFHMQIGVIVNGVGQLTSNKTWTSVMLCTWWFTLDLSTSAVLVHVSRSSGTLTNFKIIRKCILTWASFSAKRRTVRTTHTQPRKLCSSTNKYIQTRFSLVMCAKRNSKQKDICNNIFGFMTRTS